MCASGVPPDGSSHIRNSALQGSHMMYEESPGTAYMANYSVPKHGVL